MSKHKLSLRRLFSNTKFLIVFSIVTAFIFWIVVALEYAPVIDNVVEKVPVKIDIENSVPDKLGLQVFGNNDYTVDLTVRGNRYDIGGNLVTADDFDVIAQTAYVNSSGNHTLKVKATLKDADADYEIIGISSEYIDVFFDQYEEKEVEVIPKIVTKLTDVTDNEYMFDEKDIILSTQTVKLTGAKSEIDKVKGAYAEIIVDEKLTESVTVDAEIKLETDLYDDFKHILINGESTLKVPVTLPVYKVQTLPVTVSFENSPPEYLNKPLAYTCSPASVEVAVMQNGSHSDDTLEVGTLDFNEITPDNNSFEFNASELVDVKILDGTKSFKVKVELTDYATDTITLLPENITVKGKENADSLDVTPENDGIVTICGKTDELPEITQNAVLATINLESVELSSNGNRIPMTVTVKNNGCWVTGTYYAFVRLK